MRERVRKMLDQIDEFLQEGGTDAADLWNIMAALRGPDDPADADAKHGSTERIRAIAFPKTAKAEQTSYTKIPAWFNIDGCPVEAQDSYHGHFQRHIWEAANAIDRIESDDV